MDKMLETLNKLYPNGHYTLIPKYRPEQWSERVYDSSFDTKAPINSWKTKPLSYNDAQVAIKDGFRVGWVVPKGMCVVDVDNVEEHKSQDYIVKLLKKFEVKYSYNYTSKGIHLLFQDNKCLMKSDSKSKCSLNLVIDTRANATGYIILPPNDPHREWGEWTDIVEELPYFLKPIVKDNTPSFIGMGDKDGRNNALFKWRSRLESTNKLTNVEVDKCIRIINENLFSVAMTNKELFSSVLKERDKKSVSDVKDNIYNRIAEDISSKYDIISYGDQFYKFNGTYYKPIDNVELEKIIHFDISKNIPKAGRSEIISFLSVKTQVSLEDFDREWHKIAVKNGVLNLVTGELSVPTKTDLNTIYVPIAYNNDPPYSPRIDQFMKEVTAGDPLKMQLLYQVAGYCLLKSNLFEKFFIFKGEGGTGKSTYLNLLHKMVGGDTNCSHVGLPDFDKDYFLATIISKLINIDDDVVDGKALENTGRFKSIMSGNVISVRQIYKAVISFKPYVTCVFACNKLPRILDGTSGLFRRMVLIELDNKVERPDTSFMLKVSEEDMEYFLFKAVEGIKLALEEGRFRIAQTEDDLLKLFKRRQSPINEWIYENSFALGDIHNVKCLSLYSEYSAWCQQNGHVKIMSSFSFKESICSIFDVCVQFESKSNDKVSAQIFYKRGEFDRNKRPY